MSVPEDENVVWHLWCSVCGLWDVLRPYTIAQCPICRHPAKHEKLLYAGEMSDERAAAMAEEWREMWEGAGDE